MKLDGSDAALSAARKDIARRLRGVCAHLDDAEFDALVARMAVIAVKYETRDLMELLGSIESCGRHADASIRSLASRSKGMNSAA